MTWCHYWLTRLSPANKSCPTVNWIWLNSSQSVRSLWDISHCWAGSSSIHHHTSPFTPSLGPPHQKLPLSAASKPQSKNWISFELKSNPKPQNTINWEVMDYLPFPGSFMNDVLVIIISQTPRQLFVIHFWFVLSHSPSPCNLNYDFVNIASLI